MNDHELLKMAAKAAGIEWPQSPMSSVAMQYEQWKPWNPLIDDGDALRLAITLDMHIEKYDDNVEVFWYVNDVHGERNGSAAETFRSQDQFAATRRAIVRAAAAIGEQLP